MPLYEFGCASCGRRFEQILSHKELDQVICPFCKSEDINRLISSFSTPGRGQEEDSSSTPSAAPQGPVLDHCAFDWRN